MAATPGVFTAQPFVRPAYVPEVSNLLQLMQAASQARQNATLQAGQNKAQGRMQIGALIADAISQFQQDRARKAQMADQSAFAQQKLAQEKEEKDRSFALQAAQFEDLSAQRQAAEEARQAAQAQTAALRVGQGDPGAISEASLQAAQADPSVAQRTRYSFGPGTTEGPEMLPTDEQKRLAAVEAFTKAQGGIVGPNGSVVMPPKSEKPEPTLEQRLTGDDLLSYLAAQGNVGAKQALAVKARQAAAGRAPVQDNEPLVPVIDPATGKSIYVRRSDAVGKNLPAGAEKPSSGVQKHALTFFNRAQQADKDLEDLEPQIQKMGEPGIGNTADQYRLQYAPNIGQSQLGQSYNQAQRAFTEARLRKDSGAAIPKEEFENDRKTYFAQPGDSKQTLEDKRRSRAAVLSALAFESGQALGEFLGSGEEASALIDSYKQRAAKPLKVGEKPPNTAPLTPGTTVKVGKYQVKVEP